MADLITIDGSQGEGGGQVLRTSLTLALATGQSFRIENIRAKRKKPGLLRQHLTAVRAAERVCDAVVDGAELGSSALTFRPGKLRGGAHDVAIGSAGSACLVLQTVLPALALATEKSVITVDGGTHNPLAPTFDCLDRAFVPLARRMGALIELALERPGFYPAGGGRIVARVEPSGRFEPIEIMERGEVRSRRARAMVAHLSRSIADRELAVVAKRLGWDASTHGIEECRESIGPGNVLSLEIECDHVTEVFTGFGERDVSAERVAQDAVQEARAWLASGVPVGPHLADQLLVPMALAGGGAFATMPMTQHTMTNADVIGRFLPVEVRKREHQQGRNVVLEVVER